LSIKNQPVQNVENEENIEYREKRVNAKNFYIVASAPQDETLQVRISGPYLTRQAAQADLRAAIDEALDIDPTASRYEYKISKVESRKPGVIQHMAAHA
jgi:hypothetical protein